jgi:hypothetical protein
MTSGVGPGIGIMNAKPNLEFFGFYLFTESFHLGIG